MTFRLGDAPERDLDPPEHLTCDECGIHFYLGRNEEPVDSQKAREHCLTNISLKQIFPARTVRVLFWFTTPEMIILEQSTEPGGVETRNEIITERVAR